MRRPEGQAPTRLRKRLNLKPAPNRRWLLRGAVVALAMLVGLGAWLATKGDDSSPATPTASAEPRIVSEAELVDIAATAGHPVYWAGPSPDKELEATERPDGSVQVRYPEEGTEAGDGSAAVLTIVTYPLANPAKALDEFAERPGAIVRRAPDGRKVVTSTEKPTSVYFVSPENSVQVEVYDPSPQRALALALSGRVRPPG